MVQKSDRKDLLESLVPNFKAPRCPYGHPHRKDICMGQSVPTNIGRRSVWCDSRGKTRPSCMSQEPGGRIWAPELPEARRAELRRALHDFDQRKHEQHRTPLDAPVTPKMPITPQIALTPEIHQITKATLFPFSKLSKAALVKVFVYIKALDVEIHHEGVLRDGIYSPIADTPLCSMINFPGEQWEIYDRFTQQFIPMPTAGLYYVLDNEFLIIRPSIFTDDQCPGLNSLCARLHANLGIRFISSQLSKALGKRRERDRSDLEDTPSTLHAAGPSKRRKTSYKPWTATDSEVIDISD